MEQAVCLADVTLPGEPLVWVNDAFTATTGYAAVEALGRNCRFLQDGLAELGHDTAGPAAAVRTMLRERRGGTVTIPNRRRDGTVFHNELSLSPLPDAAGRVRCYVAVQRDVTDRVLAQAAERAAHAEAAELAAELQRQLVPRALPPAPGYDVAVRYQPATRADGTRGEVSGDFYDLLPGGVGRGALAVIGDVSGRGPRAAATTAAFQWTVRALSPVLASPGLLLQHVGDVVQDAVGDRFATVAAVRLSPPAAGERGEDDGGDGRAVLALAGHPQAVLVRPDAPAALVGRPGTLLGPFGGVSVPDAVVTLRPGDALVLYTDGVVEAVDPGRRLLGEEGLLAALDAVADRGGPAAGDVAERLADAVVHAVGRHVGAGPTDDLTLLVLRRRPGPRRG
nr:PP2C family protein-serine/threonine phosphatase [Kineococcus siccus]